MYDCWHQDPEQRPSFSDLHKTITKMLEDAQVGAACGFTKFLTLLYNIDTDGFVLFGLVWFISIDNMIPLRALRHFFSTKM